MAIEPRRPRADELQAVQAHIARSINALCSRHGFGEPARARPAEFQARAFAEDPEGFGVACEGDALVASSFAWSSGRFWFLAELFVAPDRQAAGVGNRLLQRAFAHAAARGAKTRALITFAFNTTSLGLYARHGLLPRLPLLMMSGERVTGAAPSPGLALSRFDASDVPLARLAALEERVLGFARPAFHHAFLLGEPGTRAFVVQDDGAIAGYVYVAASGHVGPLLVATPRLMGPVFEAALAVADDAGPGQVSACIPGIDDAALAIATRRRMRIVLPLVLVGDRAFGDWQCYLPRNPGFM